MSAKDNLPEERNQKSSMPANRNLMQMMDEFFAREPYRGILDSIDSFFQNSPFNYEFPVNFFETNNEWVVQAELPGVKRENIQLEVLGDRLKIAVANDQTAEENNNEGHYYRRARAFQRTERIVPLPYTVSRRNTKASYRNGILEVRGPRINRQNVIDID